MLLFLTAFVSEIHPHLHSRKHQPLLDHDDGRTVDVRAIVSRHVLALTTTLSAGFFVFVDTDREEMVLFVNPTVKP